LRLDALATAGYVANWRFAAAGGSYFDHAALSSPLRHTWSLGVEEQFYLIWPLACVAVLRCCRRGGSARRRVGALAAGGAVASVLLMALMYRPGHDPTVLYYRTDTRAQAVLVGAALAALLSARGATADAGGTSGGVERARPGRWDAWRRPVLVMAGWLGAAVTVAAWVTADGRSPPLYRGGFGIVALGAAAVIAAVVRLPGGILARALGWGPLPALGRVSYGVYLWHWPVFLAVTAARTGLVGPPLLAVRVLVTAGLAAVSYHVVEMPVRRGAVRLTSWRARAAVTGAAALTVAAALAATAVPRLSGIPAAAVIHGSVGAPSGVPGGTGRPDAGPGADARGRPGTPVATPAAPAVPKGRQRKVLIVGDSVALTLGYGFPGAAHPLGADVVDAAVLNCGLVRGGPYRYFGEVRPALPQCQHWEQRWVALLDTVRPDVVAVLVGRWEVMDWTHDGHWTHIGDPAFDAYLAAELDSAVRLLGSRGAGVALLTAPVSKRGERPDGGSWPEDDPARIGRWNQIVRDVAVRSGARLVDFGGRLSPGGQLVRVLDGVTVRSSDGVHLTAAGGRWIAPWLAPELVAAAPPPPPAAAPPRKARR